MPEEAERVKSRKVNISRIDGKLANPQKELSNLLKRQFPQFMVSLSNPIFA